MEAKIFSEDKNGMIVHWTVEHEDVDGLTAAVGRLFGWLDLNEFGANRGFGNGAQSGPQQANTKPAKSPVPPCNYCAGDVWDNRENKRSKNGPDFKCKERECGGAAWIQKDGSLKWNKPL